MSDNKTDIAQLRANNTNLAEYYSAMSRYAFGGGTPPSVQDMVAALDYDDLLRKATVERTGGSDFSTATAVEEVHNAAAHLREFAMASSTKIEIYLSAASEYQKEAEYYRDRVNYLGALLQGNTIAGYLP